MGWQLWPSLSLRTWWRPPSPRCSCWMWWDSLCSLRSATREPGRPGETGLQHHHHHYDYNIMALQRTGAIFRVNTEMSLYSRNKCDQTLPGEERGARVNNNINYTEAAERRESRISDQSEGLDDQSEGLELVMRCWWSNCNYLKSRRVTPQRGITLYDGLHC